MLMLQGAETFQSLVTSLRPLELFFDDLLVDVIGGFTKLYNH